MRLPSLYSHYCRVVRRVDSVDAEGTPKRSEGVVCEFYGGFGAVASDRQAVYGSDGQLVVAAVSTTTGPDVKVGDKLEVAGREWAVVGIRETGATTRILLAAGGAR